MQVTFKANANFMGYKVGKIYTEELTPELKAALLNDRHLSLIDPPTLEVRRPVEEKEDETETKKKSGRKPVENNKDDDDNGDSPEREESIQDSGSSGAS